MKTIDLNADLGESYGRYTLGHDAELLAMISSANIACGYHAGDPSVLRKTLVMALQHRVAPGAHPSYPDLQGFGRRSMNISPQEVQDMVMYQVGAVKAMTEAEGGRLQHVKPHGALYNDAAKDESIARAIAQAVHRTDPDLILFAPPGSLLEKAAGSTGLHCAREVFADRAYTADGQLVPRSARGAVIEDATEAIHRVVRMITERSVESIDGKNLSIHADTVCIHGDHPGAVVFATALRQALTEKGIRIQSFSEV